MKQICLIFARTLIAGVLLTQAAFGICGLAGITAVSRYPVRELVFLGFILVLTLLQLLIMKQPTFPGAKLGRLLETEGYSAEFYRIVFDWREKCGKRGRLQADLAAAELLIDGGHYGKGFELLDAISPGDLEPVQKQVYFNTLLYGTVLCGDIEAAEQVYERGKKWLLAVTKRPLSASVKHTLGCFEYSRDNADLAEELFMQALDGAASNDVICEAWLGLTACYLDTGRLTNAREAIKQAGGYACTIPLKRKVARMRAEVPAAQRPTVDT